MAVGNQVFSLADDVARYVKACGKRSILECKPLQGKINPKEIKYGSIFVKSSSKQNNLLKYSLEVAELSKETRIYCGKIVQRFDAEEVLKLAPIMKASPTQFKYLLSFKFKNQFGEVVPCFNASNIESLVPLLKKYPNIVEELLNDVNPSGTLRFSADEISLLTPLMRDNSEIVRKLLKEKVLNQKGQIINRFSAEEIINLASVIKKEPAFQKIISETITVNGYKVQKYNNHAIKYLSENFQEYSMIKDENVLAEIDFLINKKQYKDADALIDAMNNIEANYSTMFGTYYFDKKAEKLLQGEEEKSYLFSKYLKTQGMSLESLSKGEITEDLAENLKRKMLNTEILVKDFELSCKFQRMAEYIKKNPRNKISNYLYEKYYLKELEVIGIKPAVIKRCRYINEKYNVKIMPSYDSRGPLKALDAFIAELEIWINASKGNSKLPPVVDFNTAKSKWYDKASVFGKSASGAYSESRYNGAISFNRMTQLAVKNFMRHEMTHTNDITRRGHKIPKEYNMAEIMPSHTEKVNGKMIQINEIERGKYYQELKKAGLSDRAIDYAYNNHKEFIAVASEGDMSKYSPEFKRVLIDFGMPEWIFNIV